VYPGGAVCSVITGLGADAGGEEEEDSPPPPTQDARDKLTKTNKAWNNPDILFELMINPKNVVKKQN
jgi:hypothetical protein